jgi:hypothetical protein
MVAGRIFHATTHAPKSILMQICITYCIICYLGVFTKELSKNPPKMDFPQICFRWDLGFVALQQQYGMYMCTSILRLWMYVCRQAHTRIYVCVHVRICVCM